MTRSRRLLSRGLILFLLLAFLPPAGCASKSAEQERAAAAGPAPALAAPQAAEPLPGHGISESRLAAAGTPAAPEAKAPAPVSQPARTVPLEQMLQSAGRTASALQPESGFSLNVPASVGDGEPFLVEFGAEGAQKLHVEWRGRSISLGPCSGPSGICQALLPVPLDEKAASLPLAMTVTWADGKKERFTADMPVQRRKYPVQKLNVAQKFVSPPPEMEEKIKRDREELRAAVGIFSNTRYWSLPLHRPVPGEVTSLYGLRRVFNNVPKNPHKGVDFDGKEGDPITALEDGVVVLVADHYYSGNIVVIDHGLGVHSAYLHLSGFNVSKGQKISRGDTIGYIGSTGRVTGPHLHLSLYVLGVSVNAATCIAM